MLTPAEFAQPWEQDANRLVRFPAKSVERLSLSAADKWFLIHAGLPDSAAPYLCFEAPKRGEVPTVAERWRLPEAFQVYRQIGFDGSGSPIALDEAHQGEVVCLDHECSFARIFVNQSIRQLAASLLAYRRLVKATQAEFGEEAFIDRQIPESARMRLKLELTDVDHAAMQAGCFWHEEMKALDEEAK